MWGVNHSAGHKIGHVIGVNVGEACDVFASDCTIQSVYGKQCNTALKFIHSASRNHVCRVTAIDCRYRHIGFSGSSNGETNYNTVDELHAIGITKPAGYGSDVPCILFGADSGNGAKGNVVKRALLDPGADGTHLIIAGTGCTGNVVKEITKIADASEQNYLLSEDGSVLISETVKTNVWARINGTSQSFPIAVAPDPAVITQLDFDTSDTGTDKRGEFSLADNRWVCQVPGFYNISMMLRFNTGALVAIFVRKIRAGATIRTWGVNSGTSSQSYEFNANGVYFREGDAVEVFVQNNDANVRNISGGTTYNNLMISGPIV